MQGGIPPDVCLKVGCYSAKQCGSFLELACVLHTTRRASLKFVCEFWVRRQDLLFGQHCSHKFIDRDVVIVVLQGSPVPADTSVVKT